MKDKKDYKELIDQIAEGLRSHEEQYEPGAWENFVKFEKKKKKRIPFFWVAAACVSVLFGSGILYYFNQQNTGSQRSSALVARNQSVSSSNNDDTKTNKNITSATDINTIATTADTDFLQLKNNAVIDATNNQLNVPNTIGPIYYTDRHKNNITVRSPDFNGFNSFYKSIIRSAVINNDSSIDKRQNVVINNQQNLPEQNTKIIQNNNVTNKSDSGKMTYFPHDALPDIPDDGEQTASADYNHWSLDAVLSPSVSNSSNKVNMGYGVAVGYYVSKKVSVNSGASYLQLTGYSNSSSSGNSNIQANVTGINIPVEIRYQISNKIYVNAGASALAVLSNKQQVNFVAANVQSDAFSSKNGFTLSSADVLDKPVPKVNAATVSQAGNNNNQNVAGFFNFSVGMKQKLGTSTNFSVEPFVSVPMSGNFGKQNIHLTNAGIRIKFGL